MVLGCLPEGLLDMLDHVHILHELLDRTDPEYAVLVHSEDLIALPDGLLQVALREHLFHQALHIDIAFHRGLHEV